MVALVDVAYAGSLLGILTGLIVGWRTANVPAVVNSVAALAVGLLPDLIEVLLDLGAGANVTFVPELSVLLAVAGLLHVVGMLGWYDTVWWWDHLTHTLSAGLLAGIVYASLHTIDTHAVAVSLSDAYVAVFTLLFTLAAGVLWEFLELAARVVGDRVGAQPVLEVYGLRDTALDLVFNVVGAILVVALDVRTLGTVTPRSPLIANLVLTAGVVCIALGTFGMGWLLDRRA